MVVVLKAPALVERVGNSLPATLQKHADGSENLLHIALFRIPPRLVEIAGAALDLGDNQAESLVMLCKEFIIGHGSGEVLRTEREADTEDVHLCAEVVRRLRMDEKIGDSEEAVEAEIPVRQSFGINSHFIFSP